MTNRMRWGGKTGKNGRSMIHLSFPRTKQVLPLAEKGKTMSSKLKSETPVEQPRLVRCSTPLCGAVAVWGGENPHIWSGYERKCDTCYHRNGYYIKSHMKRLPDTSNDLGQAIRPE